MITARKTQRFCRWFSRHCERRIATHFAEVRVHGLEQLRSVPAEVPLVVVSNHVSWWDPVLAIYLAHRVLGRDGYALMDAASLRRLRFFRRVGGFGVDLDDANDGAAAVRYAARLLRPDAGGGAGGAASGGEGRLVWVFPQGAERPAGVRPLGFLPGAAAIARLAPHARVVPLALRYEHQEREQPYVYVEIGTALEPQRDVLAGCAAQQVAVQGALERIDVALTVNDMARYERLLGTRPGRLARFGEWALSRLFG